MNLEEIFNYQWGSLIQEEEKYDYINSLLGRINKDIAARISFWNDDQLLVDSTFSSLISRRVIIRRRDWTNGPAFIVSKNKDWVSVILHDMRNNNSTERYNGDNRRR